MIHHEEEPLTFEAWPKTPRLFRDITVTEKIDGTNGAVIIRDRGEAALPPLYGTDGYEVTMLHDGRWYGVGAQSRNRLVRPGADNAGFAAWVHANAYDLTVTLGVGRHFGEWWGKGIQRGYGMDRKLFSLFNVDRHANLHTDLIDRSIALGIGLNTVPVLYRGRFDQRAIENALIGLRNGGSWAAPGFANPEGIVMFHHASRQVYKTLLDNDELPKGVAA